MLNQNLNRIIAFQVVAECGEIAGAARLTGLTPSAISQSIKKFESEMGGQLFLREHKKIILTPIGRRLLADISPVIGKMERLLQNYSQELDFKTPIGTLRIGAPTEIGSDMLVKAVASFQQVYPRMKVILNFASPNSLAEKVSEGELDFCLCADTGNLTEINSSLSIKRVFDEELVFMGHRELLKNNSLEFDQLVKLPHLDYTIDGGSANLWYKFHFKKEAKNLPVVLVAENAQALLKGVKAKMGVAILPINRFRNDRDLEDLVSIKPTKRKLVNPILLIQHIDKIPTPAEKALLKAIENFRD